ncbi:hypothetical protein L6E12_18130 [Actinokineospora sp. PR83]|uniref:DUF6801 domain-containing protein n=1 Tax=Actinokineospora sp. PR83 TaxID=2884908 RepID=UPI001F3EDB53|nr:DUF6801 domain-containing protein [Actinokineospora sp. PR83]MCG8917704.1 hypothetical protein [Actinokineospora sp. PR83]
MRTTAWIVATVAAAVVGGGVAVVGTAAAGETGATRVSELSQVHECAVPSLGQQAVVLRTSVDLPESVPVGTEVPGAAVTASVDLGAEVTGLLRDAGATEVVATVAFPVLGWNGETMYPKETQHTFAARQTLPGSGSVSLDGTTTALHSIRLSQTESLAWRVGALTLTSVTGLRADGTPAAVAAFDSRCALRAGEPDLLAETSTSGGTPSRGLYHDCVLSTGDQVRVVGKVATSLVLPAQLPLHTETPAAHIVATLVLPRDLVRRFQASGVSTVNGVLSLGVSRSFQDEPPAVATTSGTLNERDVRTPNDLVLGAVAEQLEQFSTAEPGTLTWTVGTLSFTLETRDAAGNQRTPITATCAPVPGQNLELARTVFTDDLPPGIREVCQSSGLGPHTIEARAQVDLPRQVQPGESTPARDMRLRVILPAQVIGGLSQSGAVKLRGEATFHVDRDYAGKITAQQYAVPFEVAIPAAGSSQAIAGVVPFGRFDGGQTGGYSRWLLGEVTYTATPLRADGTELPTVRADCTPDDGQERKFAEVEFRHVYVRDFALTGSGAITAKGNRLPFTADFTGTAHTFDSTTHITGDIRLGQTSAPLRLAGVLPAKAQLEFVQQGRVSATSYFLFDATVTYAVKAPSITVFGLKLPLGTGCGTTTPTKVDLYAHGHFDLVTGGKLVNSPDVVITPFTGCGLFTSTLTTAISDDRATATLTFAKH